MLAQHTSAGSSIPGDRFTHAQRQQVYGNLTGYDITDLMVKLSKVNLFLHGFPDPAIHIYDTLSNDARWNEKADLILANPPFMTPKGGVTPHTKFRIAAKKAEVLFTDYIAEHLSSTGRGGVIVPNGIVATTQNAYVKLRRFLVEDCLVAVVSLPSGVFKPYSGVKCSILFFDKQLARKTREVLFLKITADGFDLGDQRREIEANDLPEAERVVKGWLEGMLNDEGRMTSGGAAWKLVPKNELLGEKHAVLATERFLCEAGAVSEEHPTTRLGDVADYIRGLTYGKGDEAELPTANAVLRAQNVSVEESRLVLDDLRYLRSNFEGAAEKRLRTDDILVCSSSGSKAHLGKVAFVSSDLPYFFGGFMGVLRSRRELIEPRFLFRLLTSQHHKAFLAGLTEGANINNLKLTEYLEYEIPLPPLEEQRRIVAEIERYQKVLDGARQILAGYRPDLQIDPEWDLTPLGEIAEVKLGKMLDKNKHTSGRLMPYLRNINVRWGSIETHDLLEMYYDEDELDRFGLKANDVLVCEGGEPGRSAVWDGHLPDLKYQKALHRVRFKVPYEPRLLVYFLQALSQTKEWEDRFHGATIKHFTREMFIELPIPLPSLQEQRRIVAELDAEAAQMEAVRSLIPRFEGKIQRVLDRVWGTTVE